MALFALDTGATEPGLAPTAESRHLWSNPLPARKFSPLSDDLTEHLRSTFNKEPRLPLVYQATLSGDQDWLEDLVSRGLSVDERTEAGDTPLCAAVRLGQMDTVRTLLLLGADPNLPGGSQQPPLALASLQRPHHMMEILLEAGAEPNAKFNHPVDATILEKVLFRDLKESLSHDKGVTPLMVCSSRGDVEGVVTLLKHGAKPSICTTRNHRYPINFAATQNYLFLMRVLLGRPADSEPDLLITVNLSKQRAWVTKNGETIESTSISTGRKGFSTPPGRYVITDKHRSHTSTLYHVAMPWFMRLNCSAIGLHAGYVTGRPASHGCVRLPSSKAQKFFSLAKVGDEVQIVE
jgi:ankyrin repeat protein